MKMKNIITSMLALSLATTTLISTPHTHLGAASKNKLSLSAKKVTLSVGASKSVSANQKVSWKLSNKKIVQVKKLSNKKLKLTGKTIGKCILTAYKGKTKKTVTIIVKAASSTVPSATPIAGTMPVVNTMPPTGLTPPTSNAVPVSPSPNTTASATPMVSAPPVQQGSTQIPTGIPGTTNPTFPSTEVPAQTATTVPTIAATNTTPTTSATEVATKSASPESVTATPISTASGPSFSPSVATTTSCANCTPSMEPTGTPVCSTEKPVASTEPVEMIVTSVNENSVELEFRNHTSYLATRGYNFTLEKKENGCWKEVPKRENAQEETPDLSLEVPPYAWEQCNVPVTFDAYFNSLPSGIYRLSMQLHLEEHFLYNDEYDVTAHAIFVAPEQPVEMTVTNVYENSVELHFCNHFDFSVGFGYNFTLEKKENGYWRKVPQREDAWDPIPNLYFTLEPGEEKNYDVPVTFGSYFNSLPSGTYRISTQIQATDPAYRSNEYQITAKATFQALAERDVILDQYNYIKLNSPNFRPDDGLYTIKNEADLSKIFGNKIPDNLKELDFTSNHVYTQLVNYSSGSYSLSLDGAILVSDASNPYVLFDYTTICPSGNIVTCDTVSYLLYAVVPINEQ